MSAREQDLYMFLETLLCTRERLVLSYVARDELTGESLPPSSVLLELREVLAQLVPPGELARVIADAPSLRRYDDGARLGAAPLARREARARRLGQSLRAALPPGTEVPAVAVLRRALSPPALAALADGLELTAPPEAMDETRTHLVVPLAALRQFLEDPLQGSARFRLRLREVEGDEAVLEEDEEPFAPGAMAQVMLLREAMTRGLLEATAPAGDVEAVRRAYERAALREELAGRAPTGLFGTAARARNHAVLEGWFEELGALGAGAGCARRVVRFGRASEHDPAGEVRPPLLLELDDPVSPDGEPRRLRVELHGRTELLIAPPAGAEASVVLTCRKNDDEVRRGKDDLRGFLDHLVLAAIDGAGAAHRTLVVRSTGLEHEVSETRFAPVTAAEARAYLTDLVRDLLTGAADAAARPTGVHDYLLPCEAIFGAGAEATGADLVGEVERLRDSYFEKPMLTFSSVYGPVPEAVDWHEPPSPELAERMARRRFGLYFALRLPRPEGEDGGKRRGGAKSRGKATS